MNDTKESKFFRKGLTKRDKIVMLGGLGGALVCFLLGGYISVSHELIELTTEALQEFHHWMLISDCFMAAGFVLAMMVCIYNLIQNLKKEQ